MYFSKFILPDEIMRNITKANAQNLINTKTSDFFVFGHEKIDEFDNEMNGLTIEGCIIHKKYYIIPNKILDYILRLNLQELLPLTCISQQDVIESLPLCCH